MSLKSAAFRGNQRLERAAAGIHAISQGESGHAVALLQAALITLKFKLAISTRKKHGAPDGVFGPETKSAFIEFQFAQKLSPDGIVGRATIVRLDSLLPLAPAPKPPEPTPPKPAPPAPVKPKPKPTVPPTPTPTAPPAMPVSKDFKIGTDDPKIVPDAGAGPWNSKPREILTTAKYAGIWEILGPAYVVIGPDAVKHMAHYLGNTGNDLTIDLEGMVKDVPSAKLLFETEVDKIKAYVEQLPPGAYDVTSTHAVNGYNHKAESKNWFFAVGGYSVWTKGRATVAGIGTGHDCSLELEYKFYDRYNWDGGKSVTIAGITVTDEAMGEFHREGMAKEYDEVGSFRRSLKWKAA